MKQLMEDIWQDRKCRMPLNRTCWTEDYLPGSTREGPTLFYSKGDRTDPKKGKPHGKKQG